jgi:HPr kinase/phosphorylase
MQIHATCVSIGGDAVLLRGSSGAGKSDLALRLIDGGAILVSDDRTELMRTGSELIATAPVTIAGKLEVRGIGIVELPFAPDAPVRLVVDLTDAVERLPEPGRCTLLGIDLPCVKLRPFEASAPAKLRLALRAAVQQE